jgi:hypothetical protein
MADNRDPKKNELREGYDPEFEVPDPDQVDEDIEESEELYGEEDEDKKKKKPAA